MSIQDKAILIAFGLILFLALTVSLWVMPMLIVLVLGWFGVTLSFWQGLLIWVLLIIIGKLFK